MKITDLDKTVLEHIRKPEKAGKIKNPRKKPVKGTTSTGTDHVSISAKSREIQKLRSVLGITPDVREDKVAELKGRIARGEYEVDPRELARKILEEI